jgi:hypothetical protein
MTLCERLLGAEQDRVHDPPGKQREQAGDHQRAGEEQDHDAAVIGDPVAARPPHRQRQHNSAEIDSRWIGLHGPSSRSWWIQNELTATVAISKTQIQPMVRWGKVPLGCRELDHASTKALIAAKA